MGSIPTWPCRVGTASCSAGAYCRQAPLLPALAFELVLFISIFFCLYAVSKTQWEFTGGWAPPARLFCGVCGQKPRGESVNMAAVMDSHVHAHHKHESGLARPRNGEGNQLTRPRLLGLQDNLRSALSYIPLLVCNSLYCPPLPRPVRARTA